MTKVPILIVALMTLTSTCRGGLEGPPPKEQLLKNLFGNPCDCGGGMFTDDPHSGGKIVTRTVSCGSKIAHLTQYASSSTQVWRCKEEPKPIPKKKDGKPGPCPTQCSTYQYEMHSSCYSTFEECTGPNNTVYFTATLLHTRKGTSGGDWANVPRVVGSHHYAQASCRGNSGQPVCWHKNPPIHISDGGGPQDQIREIRVQKRIQELIDQSYPKIQYHPLVLPKSRGIDLDTQTSDILKATHAALNASNPGLAKDCWLCMVSGTPMPIAIPSNSSSLPSQSSNCSYSVPFRIQPVSFTNSTCIQGRFDNDTFSVDVGFVTFTTCASVANYSTPLCPPKGQVFICGGNMALTFLPANWTGLCVMAILLPDIDIVPGDEPVPIPTLDYIAGRSKRAVQLIPILVGLGITGALATGSAGVGVAVHSYAKLSNQLIDDVQTLSGTIQDIQDQLDSLAEVVLQNRRGLDLLTAEQGGICLALQERCCFYANKSGIVRDKIKRLQEDLVKRRRELFNNPFWSAWNGMLPYLLPLLGPLVGLLILLSVGPCLFNRLMAFVRQQIDILGRQSLQVHYHRLEMTDEEDYARPQRRPRSSHGGLSIEVRA